MDATQQLEDSFIGEEEDSDDEHEQGEGKRQREPVAVLKVFRNNHLPETEVHLYQGENVLGRDPTSCSVPLQARSISGRHAIISISVFGPNDRRAHSEAIEALLWDLGSLNGTRKGRLKLTPHVRYALTDGDSVVLADLPCQYVNLKNTERSMHTSITDYGKEKVKGLKSASSSSEGETGKGAENGSKKSALPPVPVWTDDVKKSLESLQKSTEKPERTLVPESDSDSDGENHGRRERRKITVSESASSDLSSPTCSTFLTPASKIIPESEDESSITPSPALKGRFLNAGNDTEVSADSSKPDPLHFNIDSDTDFEDEELERTKATPGSAEEADTVNPAVLHMDRDTDVEEEEMEKDKSDPEHSATPAKQDSVNPDDLTMDSDTDVEDDDEPVKTDITRDSGPEAALEEKKESTSSAQFHMDSDTDAEDEDGSHIQASIPATSHKAELNMNSDTDVEEEEETQAIEPPSGKKVNNKDQVRVTSLSVPDAKVADSDTDVEDDVTEVRAPAATEVKANSQTCSKIQTGDDRTTDVPHDCTVHDQPPAETVRDEFQMDSDTDAEEEKEKVEEKKQQCAETAVDNICTSTPRGAGLSEEEMETQAYLSPSQLFKRPVLPSLLHPSASPRGISHTDDDFAVAETQSFVCDAAQADATLDETAHMLDGPEARHQDGASSFQLGLSDSSHQLPEAEEHDRPSTEEDWQLQATQLYAMKNSEGSTKAGQTQPDLDATQAYTYFINQEEEEEDGGKHKEEETQPLAAPGQLITHKPENEENSDHNFNDESVVSEAERKAEEDCSDEMQVDSHLSTADTLLIVRSPRQEEPTQPYALIAAEISKEQEEHESRDQEVQETGGEKAQNGSEADYDDDNEEGRVQKVKESMVINKNGVTRDGPEEEENEERGNKGVEHDNEARTQPAEADTYAETQPMCEEEEAQEEEKLNKPSSSRGIQPAKVESAQPLESDVHTHVEIAETLPICEEEEAPDDEEDKPKSSRGPGRRKKTAKVGLKRPVDSDKVTSVTVAETQPMCEEDDEGQEEEQQNEAVSSKRVGMRRRSAKTHVSVPETLPTCEDEEEQEEKPQGKSGRKSQRGRQTAKTESAEPLEPDSTAETMKIEEEDEEKDSRRSLRGKERGSAVSGKGKGRGRPPASRGKIGKVEQEEDNEVEADQVNKGRGRNDPRQKSKDYGKVRLEVAGAENEGTEHLKNQVEEMTRIHRESVRLEKERKEREEQEKRDQEEKDRLEREKRDGEEKESREEKGKQENEKRTATGKRGRPGRRGGNSKKEEEQETEERTNERLENEQVCEEETHECDEGSNKKQVDEEVESEGKSRRGRRATRKLIAPPVSVEDEGGPAKRTRSRSNSSNSVCSEQSTQESLGAGRRGGGRRKPTDEVKVTDMPSGRRRTTRALPKEKEDIKQAVHSRSNSTSSERSSSSAATQSQGRGGNRRKSMKVEEPEKEEEKREQSVAVSRGRGRGGKRPGANCIKAAKEEVEVMSVSQDSVTSQSSSRGHKRGADNSMLETGSPPPTPKTPRRSLVLQTHKVLFTGVVDEEGEKVLGRLGGGMAKGVADMTHLVTDKVRRTVKFLCAVARGVPIVTPDWLNKCGKAGSFLSPNGFLVKDVEQEKRFNFSLQEALRVASSQPLLKGYEIHVTPSVKPEPVQMKEIIACCGARFLPKMPSAHKAQTVVVSCEEDRALCERARSLSLPLVTAEFLLTGILQQNVDLQTHALSLSPAATMSKPASRSRGK